MGSAGGRAVPGHKFVHTVDLVVEYLIEELTEPCLWGKVKDQMVAGEKDTTLRLARETPMSQEERRSAQVDWKPDVSG